MMAIIFTLSIYALILVSLVNNASALIEHERMEEYHRRGHSWPPTDFNPDTQGWKSLNEELFQQLHYTAEESPGERYQAYMTAVHSALLSKNFTKYGWGITRAPKNIVELLKNRLHDGLSNHTRDVGHEREDVCLETDLRPYFIGNESMNHKILHDLLPIHEAWSGVELVPHSAYGLRVYRNDSNLLMHVDKQSTHVISGILHVDHGMNDEPWPLVIEDFHGNTNEVFLESGDLLFYESSKCRHGRPKKFNGTFYSSLFLHYYPKYDWNTENRLLDIHYRIPSSDIWLKSAERTANDTTSTNEMALISLCMKEPLCEHEWCRLKDSLKWYGPGPDYGKVLSGDGDITDLLLTSTISPEESFEKVEDEL
jgi:hypothetical protein